MCYIDHTSMHSRRSVANMTAKRAHVIIPEDLLDEVDALVGPRHRSEFFVDAAREKLARERLRRTAHEMAGSLRHEHIPGWETPAAASAWVRSLRAESDSRTTSGTAPE
jgi:hypothetical protein